MRVSHLPQFDLKISDLKEAIGLSLQWAIHTISLLDPDINEHITPIPIKTPHQQLQRYYFHDIDKNDFILFLQRPKLADVKQIRAILEFTAPLQLTDKLLIHCHSGISRSTAVAGGVLCQHGLAPHEAIRYVLSIRPQAVPNQHVLSLFDKILKLKGELIVAGIKEVDKFHHETTVNFIKNLFSWR